MKKLASSLLIGFMALSLCTNAIAANNTPRFNCNLTVQEDRVLTNKVRVAQVSGGWDYIGRRWWWDIALFPVCVAAAGIFVVGIYACFASEYASPEDGNPEMSFGNWSDALTAKPAPESWYNKAKMGALRECNAFIRSHDPDDIIIENGEYLLARHYECSKPFVQNTAHGKEILVDVLYGEPTYPNSSAELLLQKKCQKLNACLAEATAPEHVQWVNEMQMQLGCP